MILLTSSQLFSTSAAACTALSVLAGEHGTPATKLALAYETLVKEGDGVTLLTSDEVASLVDNPFVFHSTEGGRAELRALVHLLGEAHRGLTEAEQIATLAQIRRALTQHGRENETGERARDRVIAEQERTDLATHEPEGHLDTKGHTIEGLVALLRDGRGFRYRRTGFAHFDRPEDQWQKPRARNGGERPYFTASREWVFIRRIEEPGKPFAWEASDPSNLPATSPPFAWTPKLLERVAKIFSGAAISEDGSRFFVRTNEGTLSGSILIFDTSNIDAEPKKLGPAQTLHGVSPDGKRFWTRNPALTNAIHSGKLMQWDSTTGSQSVIPTPYTDISAFHPPTETREGFAIGTDGVGPKRVWHLMRIDPRTATVTRERALPDAHRWVFSPDGKYLLELGLTVPGEGFHVKLWTTSSFAPAAAAKFPDALGDASFSPDGKKVLITASHADGRWAEVYDVIAWMRAGNLAPKPSR